MKIKIIILSLVIVSFAYVFSYVLVRKNNTVLITERDGCPIDGCSYVYFQQGTPYLIYSPLIHLDERINHAEFIFTGWKP